MDLEAVQVDLSDSHAHHIYYVRNQRFRASRAEMLRGAGSKLAFFVGYCLTKGVLLDSAEQLRCDCLDLLPDPLPGDPL